MRSNLLAAAVAVPCVVLAGSAQAAAAPDSSAATWQMPWQIAPLATVPGRAAEDIMMALVPGTGMVRGTREALANLGTPLRAVPGRNRTVEACRNVVGGEAMKIGAKEVEAVSAGRQHRVRGGKIWAPVRMRITYAGPNGYEVREATMICVTDLRGKILDAYV